MSKSRPGKYLRNPEWDEADRMFERIDKRVKAQSRVENLAQLMAFGMVDKHGNLTYLYGGDADPDESYEPLMGSVPTREDMMP